MKKEDLRTAVQQMDTYQFGQKKELTKKLSKVTSYVTKQEVVDLVSKLDKLDEPEKVVIPQFVADWIEANKREEAGLGYAITDAYGVCELGDWIVINETLFARAWLDGYAIEQPKLLTVIVKDYDKTIMSKQMPEDDVNKIMEGMEK